MNNRIDADMAVAICLSVTLALGAKPQNIAVIENEVDGVVTRDAFGLNKSGEQYHITFQGGKHYLGKKVKCCR